jgi:uncharacterized protein (DUF2062 family)
MGRIGAWFGRKVRDPLLGELRKGTSPEALALAAAVGVFLCVSPIIGTTTVLCLLTGWLLRLNHVVLQVINFFSYPLQLALVVPLVRLGELVCRAEPVPLNPAVMAREFAAGPGDFLARYWVAGLHGLLGWAIIGPFVILGLNWLLRGLFRRAALRLTPSP